MQDLHVNSQGGFSFEIAEDSKALRSQLAVFLSIRASNGHDDGELDYDINQGLDYDLLMETSASSEIKSNYIKNKIKKYYPDINDIKNIEIFENKSTREINITFEFKSIYDDNYIKVGV
ncbi:MAG: hypothetical protein ACRC0G_10495 [Fusobacteriaceae bacterium]